MNDKGFGYESIGFKSRVDASSRGMCLVEDKLKKIKDSIGKEISAKNDFIEVDIEDEGGGTYKVECKVYIIRSERLQRLLETEGQVLGGARINTLLKSRGMSKLQLAQLSGIAPSDLYLALKGSKPFYPDWRRRVSRALGISEESIFSTDKKVTKTPGHR
jgi:lambda repressor-like predicted transcriptional regulator